MRHFFPHLIRIALLLTAALSWADERSEMIAQLSDPILYVSRSQYAPDHHNTATLFQRGEINADNFNGGGALKVWFPETDTVKTLLIFPEGIVRDPTISFDGKKVLFSFRPSKACDYHIGELELDFDRQPIVITEKTDTASIPGFRQITFLDGVSDIDPIYLPDGRILFSSTREPKYCMCNRHIMANLCVMNSDGSNVEQIGRNTLFEGHPSLMSDGRILYDRWEYVDRDFGDAQGIWVANPDGTKHEIYWGNNTASPGGVIDARVLPGSDSVFICIFSSCHDRPWGAAALVDRRAGIDGKDAVLMTWPPETREWVVTDPHPADPIRPITIYDTFGGSPRKFEDPWPITDDFFLAAGVVEGEQTGIWGLDTDGRMVLLHDDPESCFDPMPIASSTPPPVIGNRVDLSKKTGTFVVSNVYEGFGMNGVAPGSVKYLRIVESPEKRVWTREYWETTGAQAPAMAWNDFNNKRILGTVPVAADGSVAFEVPAERFVYFQLLDENKMLIQSMRSGIMVRPGETNACVGCHEDRLTAPASANLSASSIAGKTEKPVPWYGPERMFSYIDEVQPVFDRYCVACHDYDKPAGKKLVLARDRGVVFNASYSAIRLNDYVRVPGAGPHNTLRPYEWGSTVSRLGKILMTGHPDPMIDRQRREMGLWLDKDSDPEAFERVVTWIDINAPYYPYYGSAYRDHDYGRSPISPGALRRLMELTGENRWDISLDVSFDRPEMSPCLAKIETPSGRDEALAIIREGKSALRRNDRGESLDWRATSPVEIFQEAKYRELARLQTDVRRAILDGEKVFDRDSTISLPPPSVADAVARAPSETDIPRGKEAGELLVLNLAGSEYRLRWCPPGSFVAGSPADEPGHNSDETEREVRIDGFWILETELLQSMWRGVMTEIPAPSYFVGDDMPVDWVSWEECRDFCRELSEKEGLSVRLPTEEEWEYACRAGSTGPYAGSGSLAETGWSWNDRRFAPLTARGKAPNAWGIYDMHGNVWEWCENLYADRRADGARVIRGGSTLSGAAQCRSAYRAPSNPLTGFYNLGFRIVIDPSH
ncbi:MAG: SUMF1/EgtB/PvdO family nonheme iron enzyme [Thermoguttaceae bacterium]|nr:SUMF1/EgtB/PvdO family nonheme iron enzyme [Thermoguttaceae bacterium]